MAQITAVMVKELRERSGLPMMDCKKALQETDGDAEAALDLLRKRGAAAAEKKAGRETGEGRIGSYVDKEKGIAALVEVRCETAPTSNNPEFVEMVSKIAKHAALSGDANIDTINDEAFVDDGGMTVKDLLQEALNKIRENMRIHRVARVEGRSSAYIHHNGRVGVIVAVDGDGGDDSLLNDFCMHAAAMNPDATTREDIPAEAVAKEQEITRQQILDLGKPEKLVDKIMMGKMSKWFSERVFVEQVFVKDDKKTVKQVADAAGVTIKSFVRMAVGES